MVLDINSTPSQELAEVIKRCEPVSKLSRKFSYPQSKKIAQSISQADITGLYIFKKPNDGN
jgi:hypothetical protein